MYVVQPRREKSRSQTNSPATCTVENVHFPTLADSVRGGWAMDGRRAVKDRTERVVALLLSQFLPRPCFEYVMRAGNHVHAPKQFRGSLFTSIPSLAVGNYRRWSRSILEFVSVREPLRWLSVNLLPLVPKWFGVLFCRDVRALRDDSFLLGGASRDARVRYRVWQGCLHASSLVTVSVYSYIRRREVCISG